MKLYLVQHGEAAAKEIDPERPLTQQGQNDVGRIAVVLAGAGIRVSRIIHSGKLRARQTADILGSAVAPGVEAAVSDDIDPLDDPAEFDWQKASGGEDTILVGHLPFMAKLASHLVVGDAVQALVEFRPGSVLCLESTDSGNWHISWMLRPELLS